MKKITLLSAVAALAISFTSCKKDYTCSCTGNSSVADVTYTAKMKKKDADKWCSDWNTSYSTIGGGSCKLK